jgi:hypothetical protein
VFNEANVKYILLFEQIFLHLVTLILHFFIWTQKIHQGKIVKIKSLFKKKLPFPKAETAEVWYGLWGVYCGCDDLAEC